MASRLRYESIEFHGAEAAEAAIARDDPAELLYVPITASQHWMSLLSR